MACSNCWKAIYGQCVSCGRKWRVEMEKGQRVTVKSHLSKPGEGLSYMPFVGILQEPCNGEGWDVVEVKADYGLTFSVYSFDVKPA